MEKQSCTDSSSIMAEEYYQAGNSLFRSSDYSNAILKYNVALNLVNIDNDLKVRILLNISQCHIQLRDTSAALVTLNEILKIDESNIKALIRLSLVYETIGDYKCGLSIIEKVLEIPTPPQLLETSLKLRSRLKQLLLQDNTKIKQEICPDHFVTSQQTLRLNFIQPPPCEYKYNTMFTIKLCITNEFGLWNRSHNMPPKDSNNIQKTDNTFLLIQNQHNNNHPLQLCCEILFLQDGNTKGNDSRNILPVTMAEVYFGEDGKAEAIISIHSPYPAASTLSPIVTGIEIALLHCYCRGKLPSGASVIDIYSLPLRISGSSGSGSSSGNTGTTTTTAATDNDTSDNCSFEYRSLENIYNQLGALSTKVDAQSIRSMHISDMQFLAFESPGYLGESPPHTSVSISSH